MNEFRHVHRATPLLQFWTTILAILAVALANVSATVLRDIVAAVQHGQIKSVWFLAAIAGFVALCAVIWLVSGIWWKAIGFRLGSEELAIKHGVISHSLRTARYDRIQAVDVVEPVIARIFGVAKVRVETAGGNNSVLEISYLKRAEAEQVRAEVLARRAGIGHENPREAGETDNAGLLPPQAAPALIPPIPVSRSIAVAVLSSHAVVVVLSLLGAVFLPGGFGIVLPFIVGFGPALWRIIDTSYGFTAELDEDVLNISYGLADRRRQSIPLGRIHAVQVEQPLLWRGTGWWRVRVSIAGYGVDKQNASTTSLLPVGTFEQALAMLAVITPLSEQDLATVADPRGHKGAQFRSPKVAKWLSPIDRDQQATTLIDDRAVVMHAGRLGHRMKVIHPSHIQELSFDQGPIGHALGLANVRLDLVRGPVAMTAAQLTRADASILLEHLRHRKFNSLTI
ncbi:PH domain-containing protein [Corynebacterium epidermidicanis]|uniref:Putative membrane protein n=1 Tax=Corynebacterium epidermidicanis TaxID=1050174 RepID=A0A0G3GS81_9CORY|nr:PH domain-containing protein [Corynebacterium epidermidicanis]AKK02408.1 putative membrane protein [Corynebacterium epidermidicanis]